MRTLKNEPENFIEISIEYAKGFMTQSELAKKYGKETCHVKHSIHWFIQNIFLLPKYSEREINEICKNIYYTARWNGSSGTNVINPVIEKAYEFSFKIREKNKDDPNYIPILIINDTGKRYKGRPKLSYDKKCEIVITYATSELYIDEITAKFGVYNKTVSRIMHEFITDIFEYKNYSIEELDEICFKLEEKVLNNALNSKKRDGTSKIELVYNDYFKIRDKNKEKYLERKNNLINNKLNFSEDSFIKKFSYNFKCNLVMDYINNTRSIRYSNLDLVVCMVWFIENVFTCKKYKEKEIEKACLIIKDYLKDYFKLEKNSNFLENIFKIRKDNFKKITT